MIQLRVRTEFSFGKTFAPVGGVVARLKEMGVTAAGIVDVDSTWGHVPWFKACTAAGIQPLLGVDLIVSDDEGDEGERRMWFLAKTTAGLSEMYRFTSKAHQQCLATRRGAVPRLYRHDVLRMSGDIAVFAGDVADGAFLAESGAMLDLSPASRLLNARKRALAEEHGLPLVETSDNAYARAEDRAVYEICSRAGTKVTPQHLVDVATTPAMAAVVEASAGLVLPQAPMVAAEGDLEAVCREGIRQRGLKWTAEYETRLQHELELIRSKNFEAYFIIVADMVRFAKLHMLVGPSRGSAAGSLVCYVSRITEIDPLPPRLYFERFIDVSRTDLPDIDLDFPDAKRHMVFDYMAEKYGNANVAHIGTVSQFRPKSALVQTCKALGIPPAATAAVKVAMIERGLADSRAMNCLLDTLETTDAGKAFAEQYPEAVIATQLEGHASHTGVHAAGLLICNDDIMNYATVDQHGIAHVDKVSAEHLGLLKIDVLGLRTLSVLEDIDVAIDWYNLPMNDQAALDIFTDGRLCGIFQFEGASLRSISMRIRFDSLNEVDAVTALARPGPFGGGVTQSYLLRKSGQEPYIPIHPLVEEHMKGTFGLPVYQEQTLAIVREIGRFDWKDTSIIRKAMSKRMGKEFFDTYWTKFKAGAAEQGISEGDARKTWDLINSMGAWQMNKAHTYSYAVISYWTAYLKAHHPLQFAAANLRHAKDQDSAIELLRELVREGVEYVPFDIDVSRENWSVHEGKLYGGFTALVGVGAAKAATLVAARDAGTLTEKQRKAALEAANPFLDIFPFQTKYGALYREPMKHGIAGELTYIGDIQEGITHGHERVFIGELIHKNPRDMNEEILVKKRGGKVMTGQTAYLDMRLRDDTGIIGGRIGARDYARIGHEVNERVPIGAHMMVRAKFFNGYRYAFITKWKRIDV